MRLILETCNLELQKVLSKLFCILKGLHSLSGVFNEHTHTQSRVCTRKYLKYDIIFVYILNTVGLLFAFMVALLWHLLQLHKYTFTAFMAN